MIATLLGMSARHLWRDRSALLLSFVLPLVFFSLTAVAFRDGGGRREQPLAVAVVDLAAAQRTAPLLERLDDDPTVALYPLVSGDGANAVSAFAAGTRAIDAQSAAGALVLEPGADGADLRVTLLVAEGDALAEATLGRAVGEAVSGRSPPREGFALQTVARTTRPADLAVRGALAGLLVVFLLFTATGASGWLIEEETQGTLSLLLTTRAGLARILGAQWLFLVALGGAQAALMIAWATVGFGLRWVGFAPLARVTLAVLATAGATAAFGLLLASLARTRAQLGAASTIAILVLSALGGSFVPQPALPETMRTIGLFVPTTWAVAGVWQALDVGAPVKGVLTAAAILVAFTAAFLGVATANARRRTVI